MRSVPDLEREYNPRATVPDFQLYLDRAAAASRGARSTLDCVRDIVYGAGARQRIDFYSAATSTAPCLVYVHGGFWRALSKEHAAGVALGFVPRGVHAALVGYDLCPDVSLDVIVEQIGEALRWCHDALPAYGVDPRSIHLCGVSAGAHLISSALLAGADNLDFASAWLVSGIYELEPVMAISVNETLRLDLPAVARNSPLRHVRRLVTPLHIRVGSAESSGWMAQSEQFAKACGQAGCSVDFKTLDGAHHFSLGMSDPGSTLVHQLLAQIGAHSDSRSTLP